MYSTMKCMHPSEWEAWIIFIPHLTSNLLEATTSIVIRTYNFSDARDSLVNVSVELISVTKHGLIITGCWTRPVSLYMMMPFTGTLPPEVLMHAQSRALPEEKQIRKVCRFALHCWVNRLIPVFICWYMMHLIVEHSAIAVAGWWYLRYRGTYTYLTHRQDTSVTSHLPVAATYQ